MSDQEPDSLSTVDSPAKDPAAMAAQVTKAEAILRGMLEKNHGAVGVKTFRKQLETSGQVDVSDISELIEKIRISGSSSGQSYPIFHQGRSFFNKTAYEEAQAQVEEAAESAAAQAPTLPEQEPVEAAPKRRENKQEEAKLVTYVVKELGDLYYSAEYTPEREYAFDVHSVRGGSDFENVDAISLDWRLSDCPPEVVAVEVKLEFSGKLVQQANNYRRFADRVWIAMPVEESLDTAAMELRRADAFLFDYVVESGLGILACRKGRGNRYEVQAVHWPRLQHPSRLERQRFLERYRPLFEEAGILEPKERPSVPKYW